MVYLTHFHVICVGMIIHWNRVLRCIVQLGHHVSYTLNSRLVTWFRSVILKPNVLVQILEEDHYNNPSGQGQVNSCVYRVMDMEGNESTINGVLLSHE